MPNYEKLLSKDPIGALEKIKDDYIRYFAHSYRIDDEKLNTERINKLREGDTLFKAPYIELLPEYAYDPDVETIESLAPKYADFFGGESQSHNFFEKFIKKGLMSYHPYGHQTKMLEHAVLNNENVVITSGTGSGKTESFLLPLFAQIYKEALNWETPAEVDNQWFQNNQSNRYTPAQRRGDSRKSAIRGLILYPMNALVEDQVRRLRKALDCDEVRTFFDSEDGLHGNRIYFGRYNGATIGSKSHELIENYARQNKQNNLLSEAEKDVFDKLKKANDHFDSIRLYYNGLSDSEKKEKEDALYIGPRLSADSRTSEMITRWDMQTWAPDIMITNVSMLSIMLMRTAESPIITQTREWIKESRDHVFQFVVDELHLHRGTSGSETACLVRMFLDAIGVPPTIVNEEGRTVQNPQLRILASTASLGETRAEDGQKSETEKFLEEFFGIYNEDGSDAFYIQEGTDYVVNTNNDTVDYSVFRNIGPDFLDLSDDQKLKHINRVLGSPVQEYIERNQKRIYKDFFDAIKSPDRTAKSVQLNDLVATPDNNGIFDDMESLRGFLIFRGFVDCLNQNGEIYHSENNDRKLVHRLPRIRFHQFFKYIEGLWGTLQPTIDVNGNTIEIEGNPVSPISSLNYLQNEISNEHKELELLRCECCGELYIGGNWGNDKDALSLNHPDLNIIPSYNPTPMVQNKSYDEYGLFWPTHHAGGVDLSGDTDEDAKDYVAYLSTGRSNRNPIRGNWIHCYLNPISGKLDFERQAGKEYIEGYLYNVIGNTRGRDIAYKDIYALPCCCPKCGEDYHNRKYVKSPIRNFRTGIDRNNQLLSKGLIYQLSYPKLIGFSDSRQDAAKQAYGIENEHYRDMVRTLFMECVYEKMEGSDKIITVRNMLAQNVDLRNILLYVREQFEAGEVRTIEDSILEGTSLDPFIKDYVDLYDFIRSNPDQTTEIDGVLARKMIKLGVNPAGVDYKEQFCDNNRTRHWSQLFNFETGYGNGEGIDASYKDRAQKRLEAAIFANSFGKYMGVSVLDSGLGYICCRRSVIEDTTEYNELDGLLRRCNLNAFDFLNAFIRILGDNYRYEDPDDIEGGIAAFDSYNEMPKKRYHRFFNRVGDYYGLDPEILGNLAYKLLNMNAAPQMVLHTKNLGFKTLNETDNMIVCPNCHRLHPNMGMGVCTRCGSQLDDTKTKPVAEIWQEHFISFDIKTEPKIPRRLHTEELTGQTDNIQERLLQFKDLILENEAIYRDGALRTKTIDMVNVTTTMEVGVDIGSLEAVFQGNMPPTRYNYQQRVGRGGRRGQAFSTAFTFCRGRNHDIYYYTKATDEIVAGTPATPKLSLAAYTDIVNGESVFRMKQAIMKRVVVKAILQKAIGYDFQYELVDTAGEFGYVSNWENQKERLQNWLKNSVEEVNSIIDYYFKQFNENGQINNDVNEVRNWILNDMVNQINEAVSVYPDKNKGLAQCLAESGYLPLYGLPSDSRYFYHGSSETNVKSIDRSLDMSISEYTPGSEKIKDKGKYIVAGLTLPMQVVRDHYNNNYRLSFISDGDALAESQIITFDRQITGNEDELNIININPLDPGSVPAEVEVEENQMLVVSPLAYRTNRIVGNNGNSVDNNDRTSSFSQTTLFPQEFGDVAPKVVCNTKISLYGTSQKSYVWHVNTNNNNFFWGKYGCACSPTKPINANFMFFDEHNNRINRNPEDDTLLGIALGCRKATEMVKLEVTHCSDNLSLVTGNGNDSAIKAAFYSAAFLIQRVLADHLDVEPDEIEIALKCANDKIPIIYLSDALPNGAGIVSYLYQEGKLEEILNEIVNFERGFMNSLISEPHHSECLTSCQRCLQAYNNRGYHHILDWRLGVGVINLMLDPSYDFGYTLSQRTNYQELSDWDKIVKVAGMKISMDVTDNRPYAILRTEGEFGSEGHVEVALIMHPLWDKTRYISSIPDIRNTGVTTVSLYNTFKLLHSDLSKEEFTFNATETRTEVQDLTDGHNSDDADDDDFDLSASHT